MELNRATKDGPNPFVFLILFVSAFSLTMHGCMESAARRHGVTTEEYEVYKLAIDSLCSHPAYLGNLRLAKLHLIIDSTLTLDRIMEDNSLLPHATNLMPLFTYPDRDTFDTQESWVEGLERFYKEIGARPATIFEYYERHFPNYNWNAIRLEFDSLNQKSYCLDSSEFTFTIPHYMIQSNRMHNYYERDTTGLRPDLTLSSGFTKLSRVSFDPSRKLAVLYFVNGVDGGGKFGFVLMTKKDDNTWSIRNLLMSGWI
jgi:hypothetical protein